MHYKNGREAKNGDKIVVFDYQGKPIMVGVLFDAVAGNDYCNGMVAPVRAVMGVNLQEALHADDVKACVGEDISKVPDTSK